MEDKQKSLIKILRIIFMGLSGLMFITGCGGFMMHRLFTTVTKETIPIFLVGWKKVYNLLSLHEQMFVVRFG